MATTIPITLVGENLGKRHFQLNSMVNDIFKRGDEFDEIKNIKEQSPIDRLFKIDLALKHRNFDYITENLKDDDMLYVSRALRAEWLMEAMYEKYINPQYLEDNIYPEMITTAVTKMQHWIYQNLKDEVRCQLFYEYYRSKNFHYALKFFMKCSKNYIENEYPKVMENISPQNFKILCEKCPKIVKILFDAILNDDNIKNMYLDKETDYFNALKHLLKTEGDMVLDIAEKYYNRNGFGTFSSAQTKFIMKKHKKRFLQKPELYAGWFLDTQALADSLNVEEVKDIVVKLAKAKYLATLGWNNYKTMEPLIKRLNPNERAEFKKKVFVDKDIGEQEENWPYGTPSPPIRENDYPTIFDDRQPQPGEYERSIWKKKITKRCLKSKKFEYCEIVSCEDGQHTKTLLDKLFDEYRFVSFDKTLYELRKRIKAEGSPQNREFMILVLVSKSGGRPDAIASLLELLAQHQNEPSNVRAAIIRSLVKRSQVWRLPEVSWNQLMTFGQGLGLDGNNSETACYEGLHAVVIRSLLLSGECESIIQKAFLGQFSTLSDYSLNSSEKKCIGEMLPRMLLSIAKGKEKVVDAVECIENVINTLIVYTIKVETYPGLLDYVEILAQKDILNTSRLLTTLFESRIGRKQLFRYTFDLLRNSDSYLNALKHDISVLNCNTAKYSGSIGNTDKFLNTLSIYFGEPNGLSEMFLTELKNNVSQIKNFKKLGRPLAILLKGELETYLKTLDIGDQKSKVLSAAIKANSHKTRPSVDIKNFVTEKTSTKQIANRIIVCRTNEINAYLEELLKYKRTARLAFTLSKRISYEAEVYIKLASRRPTVAIKVGLKVMRGDKVNSKVWDTLRPLIENFDVTKAGRNHIIKHLGDIDKISIKIKPEYTTVIYNLFTKISVYSALPPLCHAEIMLFNVNENFIENLLCKFLQEDFNIEKQSNHLRDITGTCLYIRVLVKYLLICTSELKQQYKLEQFCVPFLKKMEEFKKPEKNEFFRNYLSETLLTLKYSKVFLDLQYVSPLPVIEKVVVWLQNMFSIIEYFKLFAELHLTMLLCKASRQCVKMVPTIFADEKLKRMEGVKMFGNLFGKYIAREVNSLMNTYFESIIEIYNDHLINYLNTYNEHMSSEFLLSMIKGIFEESKGTEHILGIFVIRDKYHSLKKEHYQELYEYMNELEYDKIQWFLNY